MKKMVNGELVDMTAEEISEKEALDAETKTMLETEKAEYEAKQSLKASAKAKLIAGEALTAEEADVIVL